MIAAHSVMRDFICGFRDQVREGLAIGDRFMKHLRIPAGKKSRILFWGVGGSGMSGEILRTLVAQYSKAQLTVHRGNTWPGWVDKDTYVIFSSYSGNSIEILKPVSRTDLPTRKILAVSSGGRLKAICNRRKIPFVQIPEGLPPRCALGYLTFSLLPYLERIAGFKISKKDIREMLSVLGQSYHAKAKQIAKHITGYGIHLYGTQDLFEPVLMRWRAQLEENSKVLASHHLMPEMFHNEIEGWRVRKPMPKICAIFIQDSGDPGVVQKKMLMAAKIIRRNKAKVLFAVPRGRSAIARMFSLILLGDWVSYYLALNNREDPLTIPIILKIKQL